mgnify:CR=1 FL=1
MVVAGGHDGIEALYSTEVLMVDSSGEFANEWCVEPSEPSTHAPKPRDLIVMPDWLYSIPVDDGVIAPTLTGAQLVCLAQ